MRKFHYNDRILELIKGKSTVICSGLGTGKTESIKEYVTTTTTKTLVVVNDIETQDAFLKDVEEYCVIYNSQNDTSFKQATQLILKGKVKTLIITKSKFNRLLATDSDCLDMFERVILDEASGLNPIQSGNIRTSITDISATLESIICDCLDKQVLKKYLSLIEYIGDMYSSIVGSKTYSQFYGQRVPKHIIEYANDFYYEVRNLYNDNKLHNKSEHLHSVFNLLDAMRTNSLYLGEYIKHGGERVINLLYSNNFLAKRMEGKTSFIVLDATANLNKYIYRHLGIGIINLETKPYPNLKFHIHKYKNITDFFGRASDDITLKIAEDIKSSDRQKYLTFCIKNKESLLEEQGFDMIDYAFSGRDIGSNVYRDETELNIIYSQTFPIHYRCLYNSVILDIETNYASNPVELRKTESRLMTERLVQLVGRTAIRKDNLARVNIHFYCVDQDKVERTQEYFGIPDENVTLYDVKDIGVPKKSVHLEDVLYTIEYGLKKAFKGQTLDLKELVRKSLYSVESSNRTIAGWFTDPRYADSLQSLMKKYKAEYYTKKGRGGGTFAKLPKGIHF